MPGYETAISSRARAIADSGRTAQSSTAGVGDPAAEDTEVGPLIRPREGTRVGEWVDEARGAGADILCGGEAISETCYAPTVVYQPPAGTRLASEEVFGPVVCVTPYSDVDEAVTRAKPTGAKGTYMKKVSISSTMGPGVSVDVVSAAQA